MTIARKVWRPKATAAAAAMAAAVLGTASGGHAKAAIPAVLEVDTGTLRGVADAATGISSFKGIPYAAPPVGDLRWKPPLPAATWSGVRNAAAFGPSCIQKGRDKVVAARAYSSDYDTTNGTSEDCLTLNVWTPAKSASDKLPVMVWIYGGGFNNGASANRGYDGAGLARKGVILVSINYRLGMLGFLATPELDRESPNHVSGNYGLLDQIAALKWVKRNIARFGGDPDKVTIFGQSAGGGSVHFLSVAPMAKGLFRAGIAQNGLQTSGDPFILERSPSAYKMIAQAEAADAEYLRKAGISSLAQLRSMSAEQIIDLPPAPFPPAFFSPVVDGWLIPKDFKDIYAEGLENDVTMMAGWTSSYYSALEITVPEYQKWARARFGALADRFLALYPASTDAEARNQVEESTHDSYRSSLYLWAEERRKHASMPTYIWWFNHELPGTDKNGWGARAGHDIPYAMNNLAQSSRPFGPDDQALAQVVSSYWSNFAKHDDPNRPGLPRWAPYDPARLTMMQIGDGTHEIPVTSPAKLALFRDFFATHPICLFGQPCSISLQ